MNDMGQWMYNLMFRKFQPDQIEAMDYQRMKFWNTGHELMIQAEKDAIKKASKK